MKIYGTTVGTTLPKPSWKQANPKKGDYIKDKPTEQEVVRGYSAYQVAVMNGFESSEAAWLESLKGADGAQGPQGEQGPAGANGKTPQKGVDYFTEKDKEELVNEVVNALPPTLSGKWAISKMAYGSPEMGHLSQDINFTSTIALYQTDDGLGLNGTKEQLVSTHEVRCSKLEIQIDADAAMVCYTVESTDAELQAVLDQMGTNRVPVFVWFSFVPAGEWFPHEAMVVDFGAAQKVAAEFMEAFAVLATQREETATTLKSVSITEHADGSVTMVNTLEDSTETIVISADANGNPNKLTYNDEEIPIEWVVSA